MAFIDVLQGVSHPRIKYPDQIKEEQIPDTGPLPPLPLAIQGPSLTSTRQDDASLSKPKQLVQRAKENDAPDQHPN